nr:MAG TPA: hypothetical protein [Caudoviricetes sp.]
MYSPRNNICFVITYSNKIIRCLLSHRYWQWIENK